MGFLSTIGGWIGTAARVVSKVVSGVQDLLDGPSVREEYEKVRRGLDVFVPAPERSPLAIDHGLMMGVAAARQAQQRADAALEQVQAQRREQAVAAQHLVLRGRMMDLALQASAFDRYVSNIQIHAANLEIHLHTLRNVTGLVEDVNALRFGLKRTMGTVNHLINLLQNAGLGHADKLAGIDVEREEGAISIRAAYDAFENTRCLLSREIQALVTLAEQHLRDVRRVQADADAQGDFGRHLSEQLEHRIVPQLLHTQRVGRLVGADVGRNFPALTMGEPMGHRHEPGHDRGEVGTYQHGHGNGHGQRQHRPLSGMPPRGSGRG